MTAPHHRRAHPHRQDGPKVYWRALATGSLVGIAFWATLYVLGAAVACSFGMAPGAHSPLTQTLLGIYGCTAASCALGLASYTAARTGGARGREGAVFYGVCLWSMSTLTLVVVAVAATSGCFAWLSSLPSSVFEVGLAAIGMQIQAQAESSPASILWCMLATIGVSLVFSVLAAQRAVCATQAN
ncbi:MAG: hypothetical protein EOO40_04705 [Deltaproteobacteria bacterium]|nr:MAG: hypothetical protein EOO40_04705 [Deltaproteobacteria bacterium]